jgi:hypothetical protein
MKASRADLRKLLREAGEAMTADRSGVRVLIMRDGMSDEEQAEWNRTVRDVPHRCGLTVIIKRFCDSDPCEEAT